MRLGPHPQALALRGSKTRLLARAAGAHAAGAEGGEDFIRTEARAGGEGQTVTDGYTGRAAAWTGLLSTDAAAIRYSAEGKSSTLRDQGGAIPEREGPEGTDGARHFTGASRRNSSKKFSIRVT